MAFAPRELDKVCKRSQQPNNNVSLIYTYNKTIEKGSGSHSWYKPQDPPPVDQGPPPGDQGPQPCSDTGCSAFGSRAMPVDGSGYLLGKSYCIGYRCECEIDTSEILQAIQIVNPVFKARASCVDSFVEDSATGQGSLEVTIDEAPNGNDSELSWSIKCPDPKIECNCAIVYTYTGNQPTQSPFVEFNRRILSQSNEPPCVREPMP